MACSIVDGLGFIVTDLRHQAFVEWVSVDVLMRQLFVSVPALEISKLEAVRLVQGVFVPSTAAGGATPPGQSWNVVAGKDRGSSLRAAGGGDARSSVVTVDVSTSISVAIAGRVSWIPVKLSFDCVDVATLCAAAASATATTKSPLFASSTSPAPLGVSSESHLRATTAFLFDFVWEPLLHRCESLCLKCSEHVPPAELRSWFTPTTRSATTSLAAMPASLAITTGGGGTALAAASLAGDLLCHEARAAIVCAPTMDDLSHDAVVGRGGDAGCLQKSSSEDDIISAARRKRGREMVSTTTPTPMPTATSAPLRPKPVDALSPSTTPTPAAPRDDKAKKFRKALS